jgi:biopolymer transport protein ExbB
MFFVDTWAELGKFMDSGGMVLWAIVVLLFVMWTLIFERMWYLRSEVGADVQIALNEWESRTERKSKTARQIREKLISEVSVKIDDNIMMIKTLVAIAPLFGLLGNCYWHDRGV